MRLLVLALFLCVATQTQAALNREVLIDAIGLVETGGVARRGKAGERGVYQLLPSVAKVVGGHDRAAALRWLDILIRDLTQRGVHISAHSVAMGWNCGARATAEGRAPVSTFLYANRVELLYHTYASPPLPLAPPKPRMFTLSTNPRPRFTLP